MNLDYNKKIILNIINKKENLGKTAVMKMVFILQQVHNVNLGYKFDIYTYGPYAAKVTEDLEALIQRRLVDASIYEYNNSPAYKLAISNEGKNIISPLSEGDEQNILRVLDLFGEKKATDLELDSTIIYIKNRYVKNEWDLAKEDIVNDVHEIKPHFSCDAISSAYDSLERAGIF